ncbi:protein DpdF [Bosea sp. BIWAKO-01]|uniref:protein DpdF n=1 Tax=Bosea sp. BIWAKO-01 TaxID=506668 RepID=UPI0008535AE1|nr:protein DpdF [Bosea sp. BIWAKO-01]GAU81822.1 ATP-dependent DNA helicase RecQ [Bosea sp. BIWAKO-01]
MRDRVDGAEFAALTQLLAGHRIDGARFQEPAFARCQAALTASPVQASSLDLAVLLRQALRHEEAKRGWTSVPGAQISHIAFAAFDAWETVGLEKRVTGGKLYVSAKRWKPDWLSVDDDRGVDALAQAEVVRRFEDDIVVSGDPFLKAVHRPGYRSIGQRAAVRAALSTPPGATLAIALATGEGKSLIFQIVQAVGFTGMPEAQARRGVTLVIVPTVALGINHEKAAIETCGLDAPLSYSSGDQDRNSVLVERISDGRQALCFASPEAACGPLRSALGKAAEGGHLKALVVDEAHLVDQWGSGFRTEFQELGALRQELLRKAQPEARLRTLLLSATLTDSSTETLRIFFGEGEGFEMISAVQLRPEPDYWIARPTNDEIQTTRVLEALYHLPRPLALYVTEVEQAILWHQRLKETGFRRLGLVHGDSSQDMREKVVNQWRHGAIDIVVGTSAFGLGIDYAHARSVVHACVPETLDRFYQEVGRAGRDGRTAISLIVPAASDFAKAERISRKWLIGKDRGRERWETMFSRKITLPNGGGFAVRLDDRPGTSERDIDMIGDRNTDWNLRVLMLMSRAGLIRLLGKPRGSLPPGMWMGIEILDHGHLEADRWLVAVEPVRRLAVDAAARNFELMQSYLRDDCCAADTFEELYGKDRIGRVCSRCKTCRSDPTKRKPSKPVGEPRSPWPAVALDPRLAALLGSDGRLLVTYDREPFSRSDARRFGETMRRLHGFDVHNFIVLGSPPLDIERGLAFAGQAALFLTTVDSLAQVRLPVGPEVVLVGADAVLMTSSLEPRVGRQRIFIANKKLPSPETPSRRLVDVFGGKTLDLDEFFGRVAA